jgi:hypothetical protein
VTAAEKAYAEACDYLERIKSLAGSAGGGTVFDRVYKIARDKCASLAEAVLAESEATK